jgi:hypothetical protein
MMFVTCSWLSFNSLIVLYTHLYELTFEFAPIVKDNKLGSQLTFQAGVMKQILDGCCWLICDFDNFKPTSGRIYDCECKQIVGFGWFRYCKWTHQIKTDPMTQRCSVRFFYFGWYQLIFLALLLSHFTYLTLVQVKHKN